MKPDVRAGDSRIGTFDTETYNVKSRKKGLSGLTLPYSAGFKYKDEIKMLYNKKTYESPLDVMIETLKELVVRKNAGHVFYVHNLAGFDSRFIVAALGSMPDFKVKLMGRAMNEIFCIKISRAIKQNRVNGG